MRTLQEVNEILKGRFQDPEDRKYWEDMKKELEIKEDTKKENEEYYNKMFVYDR